jgi:hypothetical protein
MYIKLIGICMIRLKPVFGLLFSMPSPTLASASSEFDTLSQRQRGIQKENTGDR